MIRRLPTALFLLAALFLQREMNALGSQLKAASVVAPAGASCVLYPKGDKAPEHSLAIDVDADGVARFETAAATEPGAAAALVLDCTGASGKLQKIEVDLRSESTFAPRPFDAVRAGLSVRPALTGDPQSYSVGELIRQGYGLRPDPKANPAGYARWLAGVRTPYHILRAVNRGAVTRGPGSQRQLYPSATITSTGTSQPWTGAILTGSHQLNANSALTKSYLANEAEFNVPPITGGLYGTGKALMAIWNGLDNADLLQAVVEAQTTGGIGSYSIHRQDFSKHSSAGAQADNANPSFNPQANDTILAEEWYCDATGNPNLAGGFACTHMRDDTQSLVWDCSQANNTSCASYKLTKTNGNLGQSAEFVVENQTAAKFKVPNLNDWPPFATVTMLGSALVVQGSGAGSTLNINSGNWVTVQSDPSVQLAPDWTNSKSFVGISLTSSLFGDGVLWADGPAQCKAGTFAPGGNVSCSNCPAGTFSAAGASACFSPCPAGSLPQSSAGVCLECGSLPTNLATTDNLVCSGQNTPETVCVAGSISFENVGPAQCPPNSVAQSTSKNWSCPTPLAPSCNVTCTATFTCVGVPPCTTQEAAAGKCTIPNPNCGHPGQKPCPPHQ